MTQLLVVLDVEPAKLEDEAQQVWVGKDGIGEGFNLFGATACLEGVEVAEGCTGTRSGSSAWHGKSSFRPAADLSVADPFETGLLSRSARGGPAATRPGVF
ncbi:MAG: hypothetical protein ABSC13_08200 [Dehalococcoidia bacterium]|jgi:hypothetical protein